jgi:ABC-type transport system substrate-binding protein
LDTSARPSVSYLGFNTLKPPFDNALVRQAFASAVDRQAIVALVDQYYPELDARVATSLTPPETLGRDLTGEIGLPFDPEKARTLLGEAGYDDPSVFPPVVIYVRPIGEFPAIPLRLAESVVAGWRDVLGVEVRVESSSISIPGRFASNPPDVYRMFWWADYNDPDNFLRGIFGSESEVNYGGWSHADYLRLVKAARDQADPQARQRLYLEAEAILCQADAAIVPLYHASYDLP